MGSGLLIPGARIKGEKAEPKRRIRDKQTVRFLLDMYSNFGGVFRE